MSLFAYAGLGRALLPPWLPVEWVKSCLASLTDGVPESMAGRALGVGVSAMGGGNCPQ